MMLHYAPYSDDLATWKAAGACPWPWGVSQSLLGPFVVHLILIFFSHLRKNSIEINKLIKERVLIKKYAISKCQLPGTTFSER